MINAFRTCLHKIIGYVINTLTHWPSPSPHKLVHAVIQITLARLEVIAQLWDQRVRFPAGLPIFCMALL